MRAVLTSLVVALTVPGLAFAQGSSYTKHPDKVASAMSAAPASIANGATVSDWDGTVLRKGTNAWTCMPDNPESSGNDPMCLDAPWLNWAHAWMNKQKPEYTTMGFGYMLAGSSPESNVEPYATGPTPTNQWISESIPHIMIIVPDHQVLEGLTTDPHNGGPWVMWKGTPYVHIMVPTTKKPN